MLLPITQDQLDNLVGQRDDALARLATANADKASALAAAATDKANALAAAATAAAADKAAALAALNAQITTLQTTVASQAATISGRAGARTISTTNIEEAVLALLPPTWLQDAAHAMLAAKVQDHAPDLFSTYVALFPNLPQATRDQFMTTLGFPWAAGLAQDKQVAVLTLTVEENGRPAGLSAFDAVPPATQQAMFAAVTGH